MDTKQINDAKTLIKTRHNAYLKAFVGSGEVPSDEKVQAFLFEIFIEGRKSALEEVNKIAREKLSD